MYQGLLRWGVLTACVAVTVLCGCALGPAALEVSRARYADVIQQTTSEQLLLNLVRLQYRETPFFLDIGSVSTQFSFGGSADAGGMLHEGPYHLNPGRLDLGLGIDYVERPTITFTPLQGKDFVNALLSPLPVDTIVLLSRSGWSIDRVLRLTVGMMNGLDNASSATGPTPEHAPKYAEFASVSRLFRALQQMGMLELGYESRVADLVGPLPGDSVALADVVGAVAKGYGVRRADDDGNWVLTGSSRVLVWRIPRSAADSAEVRGIVELLGLAPGRSRYEIHAGVGGERGRSKATSARTRIDLSMRSLMGTLFYLSQGIEVPQGHRDRGLVTKTMGPGETPFDWTLMAGDLLRIHSQSSRPQNAAVAVKRRGYWYYVDDADLSSKSTFALLSQLFALQAGGVESVAPVLTLPVGG